VRRESISAFYLRRQWGLQNLPQRVQGAPRSEPHGEKFEVIGNIYENAELLKQKRAAFTPR
jgi:hypothetical protein